MTPSSRCSSLTRPTAGLTTALPPNIPKNVSQPRTCAPLRGRGILLGGLCRARARSADDVAHMSSTCPAPKVYALYLVVQT